MSAAARPLASEEVLFAGHLRTRHWLAALWTGIALVGLFLADGGSLLAMGLLSLAASALAAREWTAFQLRVTERSLEHLPPLWAPSPRITFPGPAALRTTARIDATEVAGLAWDGHDGVGIRLRDGSVEVVALRDRIVPADQDAARAAVLRFVERATA